MKQIKKLTKLNKRRQQLARRLTQGLIKTQEVVVPRTRPGASHLYQMYAIKVPSNRRVRLIQFLKANGVQASVHFDPPVHRQVFYKQFSRRLLPNTDKLSQTEVTLPLYPGMNFGDIDYIAKTIENFFA